VKPGAVDAECDSISGVGGVGGIVGVPCLGSKACDGVGDACPGSGGGEGVYRDVAAGDGGVWYVVIDDDSHGGWNDAGSGGRP